MVVAVVQETRWVYNLLEEMVVVLKHQIIIRLMVVMELQTLVEAALVLLIMLVRAVLVEVESLSFVIQHRSNPVHKLSTDPLGDPWRVL